MSEENHRIWGQVSGWACIVSFVVVVDTSSVWHDT